jgi:hypothetical protein
MSVRYLAEKGWNSPRRDRRAHSYAEMVGAIVCRTLQNLPTDTKRPRNGVLADIISQQFEAHGLIGCMVEIRAGEAHAFIGLPDEDEDHGHVIVPLKTRAIRYCRGYGEGRRDDAWNRWPYTRMSAATH